MNADLIADKKGKKIRSIFMVEQALEYFVQILVTGAFLASLLSRNGVPDWLVGILSSFISLTCIFQVFSPRVVKPGSSVKRVVFYLILSNEILFTLLYVIPLVNISQTVKCIVFVVLIFAAYVLYNLVNPIKFSWYMLYVSADNRGAYTAKKEMISLVGGIAFSFLMGSLSDYFTERGEETLAFVMLGFAVIGISIIHLSFVGSTPEFSLEVSRGKSFFSSLRVLKNKTVLCIIALEVIWKISMAVSNPFYGIYQTSELGFTLAFVSVLSMCQSISRTVVSPVMGKLADRFGWRVNMMICFFFAILSYGIMVICTPQNGSVTYLLHNVFFGVAMAGLNSGFYNVYFDYVPVADRTSTLGVKAAVCGVIGFTATSVASAFLAKIQSTGFEISGTPIYAQQVLSTVSTLLTAVAFVYTAIVIGRLKKIEE